MGEYKAPELEDLGSIGEFTKWFGDSATGDAIFDDEQNPPVLIPGTESDGSRDAVPSEILNGG